MAWPGLLVEIASAHEAAAAVRAVRRRAVVTAVPRIVLAAVLAVADSPAGAEDEGAQATVAGRVESIRAEEDGRVPVAVRPYAQMYFLHRSHPRFDELLRLLREARSSERAVKCTFRRFSGRIVAVEWADGDEAARPASRPR